LKLRAPIFLLVALGFAFTLQSDLPAFKIKAGYDYFTTDNIGNIYLVKGEQLTKYSNTGVSFKPYSNKRLGNITKVDATNALKILLYYKDFQQIVFLDNQLSQNGEPISLEELNHEQTELVCSSFNNSFWIYDKQNNELTRFNESSLPVAKTGNLKQILQMDFKPNFMLEHNSFLYLSCPENGIYVFDTYGTFNKVISIKGLKSFQVSNNIVYFFKEGRLVSYNAQTFEETSETHSDTLIRAVRIEKDRLFRGYSDSLEVFVNTPK